MPYIDQNIRIDHNILNESEAHNYLTVTAEKIYSYFLLIQYIMTIVYFVKIKYILGDLEVTANIYCKSRKSLPNTYTQNYSTDLL